MVRIFFCSIRGKLKFIPKVDVEIQQLVVTNFPWKNVWKIQSLNKMDKDKSGHSDDDIKKTSPTSCVFCRHCKQPDRRRAFHRPNINTFFSLTILNKPHKTIKLTDLYSKADWPSLCLLLHCILGIVRSWEMISIATGLHGFAYYLQQ